MMNDFLQRIGVTHPIIQAPLAGGGDTPDLVAAVGNAGALGFIGAAYLTPAQIGDAARVVQARSARPFGVNLFVPLDAPALSAEADAALACVAPYFAELGLPPPAMPDATPNAFPAQLRAALDTGAAVFSFTLGLLPAEAMTAVRAHGMTVIGTATTVEEAMLLEASGVDAVVAQGSEAGGHRGTFAHPFGRAMIGTMALVPQVVDALRIPVIASGGVMDGRGVAAALALGASAVQMGTAFLACDEAGIPAVYRQALLEAHEDGTQITKAFSGRPARGIINRFMTDMENAGSGCVLPFPLQNALTRPLRTAAGKLGRAEFLSLWAGQGVRMARRQTAGALVIRICNELDAAVARMQASAR